MPARNGLGAEGRPGRFLGPEKAKFLQCITKFWRYADRQRVGEELPANNIWLRGIAEKPYPIEGHTPGRKARQMRERYIVVKESAAAQFPFNQGAASASKNSLVKPRRAGRRYENPITQIAGSERCPKMKGVKPARNENKERGYPQMINRQRRSWRSGIRVTDPGERGKKVALELLIFVHTPREQINAVALAIGFSTGY